MTSEDKEKTYDYDPVAKPDPSANGRDRAAKTVKVRIDGSHETGSARITPSGHVRRDSSGEIIEG